MADYQNIVLVAATIRGKDGQRLRMAKVIAPSSEECQSYDDAAHFNFISEEVDSLLDVLRVVEKGTISKHACLLRCVLLDPAKWKHQRRIIKTGGQYPPTLVEQPQNWFAIDVDNYGAATGDVMADANTVLLGLPTTFHGAEFIALASSNYLIKSGIRMRLFFWNKEQVTSYDIKRYLTGCRAVDLNAIKPSQPIYVATAEYRGMDDPLAGRDRLVYHEPLFKRRLETELPHIESDYHDSFTGNERFVTKQEAIKKIGWIMKDCAALEKNKRNDGLFFQGRKAGKLVAQGHFTEDYVLDALLTAYSFCPGDKTPGKDEDTIKRGIETGKRDMMGF